MKKILMCMLLCISLIVCHVVPVSAGVFGDLIVGDGEKHPVANPAIDVGGDVVIGVVGDYGDKIRNVPKPTPPAAPTPTPTTPGGNVVRPNTAPASPAATPSINKGAIISGGAKIVGGVVSVKNAYDNTKELVTKPVTHRTETGQRIEVGLKTANACLSIAGAVGAVVVMVGGAPITAVAGVGFVAVSATVAIANNAWKGDIGKGIMDLATGRARIGFAPLENNEGLQDGLDIIHDDLGFDLYPGRGHARRNISVEKPNIYLYSDKDMDVTVTLDNAEYITKSDPYYGEGWKAEIRDGSINGVNDYLFYEADVPEGCFQKTSGYVIHAETFTEDLIDILDRTGYNAKEKADFLEYWLERIDVNKSYLMCPQDPEVIESVMKLNSSVEPDSLNRYWYYFTELPEVYKTAEIVPIVRDGYTVVEWGGMAD